MIWEEISLRTEGVSADEIVGILVDSYRIEKSVVETSVNPFLLELADRGLVERVAPSPEAV